MAFWEWSHCVPFIALGRRCHNQNWARRQSCNKCGAVKPDGLPDTPAVSTHYRPPSDRDRDRDRDSARDNGRERDSHPREQWRQERRDERDERRSRPY